MPKNLMLTYKDITPNKEKALYLAKRHLSEFVCDAVNLEEIDITIDEVNELLTNLTIDGHSLSDQTIILNQADAWKELFSLVETNSFVLTKENACSLHKLAAKEEALKWGCFRDGKVTIAGTDYIPPVPEELDDCWSKMLESSEQLTDIYDRAIFVFLQMARYQFFYDVNKRMGRFMMNGILLSQGYPAINLPAKRKLEFNQHMLEFYSSADPGPITAFMKDCLEQKIIEAMM